MPQRGRGGCDRFSASLGTPLLMESYALAHLVGDRSRNRVDGDGAHLGIAAQQLDEVLLLLRFRFASLLPQLLAGRLLVLLDDNVLRRTADGNTLVARITRADQLPNSASFDS
jgi:hypothetical protein